MSEAIDSRAGTGVKTYSEMNAVIAELLRLRGDGPSQYAAARIDELEVINAGSLAALEDALDLLVSAGMYDMTDDDLGLVAAIAKVKGDSND